MQEYAYIFHHLRCAVTVFFLIEIVRYHMHKHYAFTWCVTCTQVNVNMHALHVMDNAPLRRPPPRQLPPPVVRCV